LAENNSLIIPAIYYKFNKNSARVRILFNGIVFAKKQGDHLETAILTFHFEPNRVHLNSVQKKNFENLRA